MKTNPWAKKSFNLTEQMLLRKADPGLAKKMEQEAVALDAEETRKSQTRTLDEFNSLDREGKIRFIKNGGEVA